MTPRAWVDIITRLALSGMCSMWRGLFFFSYPSHNRCYLMANSVFSPLDSWICGPYNLLYDQTFERQRSLNLQLYIFLVEKKKKKRKINRCNPWGIGYWLTVLSNFNLFLLKTKQRLLKCGFRFRSSLKSHTIPRHIICNFRSLFYLIYISANSWYLNKPDENWYWPVQISQLNSISRCLISPCKIKSSWL